MIVSASESIAKAVNHAIDVALVQGGPPLALHEVILGMAEKPLLDEILKRVHGNQVSAAAMLGINRNTLRKKLRAHNLTEWLR